MEWANERWACIRNSIRLANRFYFLLSFHNCFCFGVCLCARACACISLPRTWWSILIHWKFLNSRKYVRLCLLNRTKMYVVNVWEQLLSYLLLSANHHHFRWMPRLHFSNLICIDTINSVNVVSTNKLCKKVIAKPRMTEGKGTSYELNRRQSTEVSPKSGIWWWYVWELDDQI